MLLTLFLAACAPPLDITDPATPESYTVGYDHAFELGREQVDSQFAGKPPSACGAVSRDVGNYGVLRLRGESDGWDDGVASEMNVVGCK